MTTHADAVLSLVPSSLARRGVVEESDVAARVVGGPGLAWPRGGSGAPSRARAVGCGGAGALGGVRGGR